MERLHPGPRIDEPVIWRRPVGVDPNRVTLRLIDWEAGEQDHGWQVWKPKGRALSAVAADLRQLLVMNHPALAVTSITPERGDWPVELGYLVVFPVNHFEPWLPPFGEPSPNRYWPNTVAVGVVLPGGDDADRFQHCLTVFANGRNGRETAQAVRGALVPHAVDDDGDEWGDEPDPKERAEEIRLRIAELDAELLQLQAHIQHAPHARY